MKPAPKHFVLAATLALTLGAQAQTTPAAPTPSSPAKKELVAKMLTFQQAGIEGLARTLVQQPAARLMQGASVALQKVPADKREATAKAIEAEVRKFIDSGYAIVRDKALQLAPVTVGPILEARFSEDELRQLVAWFENPVNKKYHELGGEMQSALAEKLVAETRSSVEVQIKAMDEAVVKLLGLPAQAAPPPTAAKPVKPASSAAKK